MNISVPEHSILRCPRCREELAWEADRAVCARDHAFPIRFGIPDFRIAPDPYIGIEEEVAKVERLLGSGGRSFEELVTRYYDLTPEVPAKLQAQYRHGLLAGEMRGRHLLDWMEVHMGTPRGPILDVGCGTAGLALTARGRGLPAYGIDVALRWLIIGRQRLTEFGIEPLLFCANAEALPFAPDTFGSVVSDSTLEHVADVAGAINEAVRVCRPGGLIALQTVNEYSLLEPYTAFPLPGFVPRKIRPRVIGRVSRTPYLVTPPTQELLTQMRRRHPFLNVAPYVPELEHHAARGGLRRVFAGLYRAMGNTSLGRAILSRIGFFLCVHGRLPVEQVP